MDVISWTSSKTNLYRTSIILKRQSPRPAAPGTTYRTGKAFRASKYCESEKENIGKNKGSEAEDNVNKSESDPDKDSKSQAQTKHQKIESRKKRRTESKKLLKPTL
jgi:hypothetical protein